VNDVGLPQNAEFIEVDGFSGWLFNISNGKDIKYFFFLFKKQDSWHIMLVSPNIDDLPSSFKQYVHSSGELKLPKTPLTERESYYLAVAWMTNPLSDQAPGKDAKTRLTIMGNPVPSEQAKSVLTASLLDADALVARVKREIFGQDDALDLLCHTIIQHLLKVSPFAPLVMVAVGPTGTGKSESIQTTVNALKELNSNSSIRLTRINLSQYREEYRISELFGSPPGYAGYSTPTNLVSALSNNPHQVILWDEMEKANPRVLTALLPLIDNGLLITPAPLKDGTYSIDCRKSIHIFSTNLQWEAIYQELITGGCLSDAVKVNHICEKKFLEAGQPSELVSRFRQFLFYRPLNMITLESIAQHSIQRVANEYGFEKINSDPSIIHLILEEERDDSLGARSIQTIVKRILEPALSEAIVRGIKGNVDINFRNGKISIISR
jgi:ATP-dependent Clp protease ATP-binding subunit ClpA